MLVIQNLCSIATDEYYKICMPSNNMNQIRALELSLKEQVQIFEMGKFKQPGSRKDEFFMVLYWAQTKVEGSRFDGTTQITVSGPMIIKM